MPVTMSSREFNQNTGRAKIAAEREPVFITDRGEPSHVLLSIESYRKLAATVDEKPKESRTLAELLYMPGAADIEIELPQRQISRLRIPDLS